MHRDGEELPVHDLGEESLDQLFNIEDSLQRGDCEEPLELVVETKDEHERVEQQNEMQRVEVQEDPDYGEDVALQGGTDTKENEYVRFAEDDDEQELDFDQQEDAPNESEESKRRQEDHARQELEYPFEAVDRPKAAAAEGELLNFFQEQNPPVPDVEAPGAIVAIANQAASSHTQTLDPMTA